VFICGRMPQAFVIVFMGRKNTSDCVYQISVSIVSFIGSGTLVRKGFSIHE
jgi:hypothetical protein